MPRYVDALTLAVMTDGFEERFAEAPGWRRLLVARADFEGTGIIEFSGH